MSMLCSLPLLFIICLINKFEDVNGANSLVVFGNATRNIEHNMTFWVITVDKTNKILTDLIKNKSISSYNNIGGGPGTTTWNGNRGEIINYGEIGKLSSTQCIWGSPQTFYVENIENNITSNPFYTNNVTIGFPFTAYGISDINIKPKEWNITKNDVNKEYDEVNAYINMTMHKNNVGIAFILISGYFKQVNISSVVTNIIDVTKVVNNSEWQMVGLFCNKMYNDIWTAMEEGNDIHIHSLQLIDGEIRNTSQGGHVKYGYFDEINVKYWEIDRSDVFLYDYYNTPNSTIPN